MTRYGVVVQDEYFEWGAELWEDCHYQGTLPALNREEAEEKLRKWVMRENEQKAVTH